MHGNQVFYKCCWSSEGNVWNQNVIKFGWRLREAAMPWPLTCGTSLTCGLTGLFPLLYLGPAWRSHPLLHMTEDVPHCSKLGPDRRWLLWPPALLQLADRCDPHQTPSAFVAHLSRWGWWLLSAWNPYKSTYFCEYSPSCYTFTFPHSPWQLVSFVTIAAVSRVWGGGVTGSGPGCIRPALVFDQILHQILLWIRSWGVLFRPMFWSLNPSHCIWDPTWGGGGGATQLVAQATL